jgi:FAD/FMN-containing dehydrogenase
MDVVVQPSVPWMLLNDQIKHSGLFFPVDPGPSVSTPTTPNDHRDTAYGNTDSELTNVVGPNWRDGGNKLQVIFAHIIEWFLS